MPTMIPIMMIGRDIIKHGEYLIKFLQFNPIFEVETEKIINNHSSLLDGYHSLLF